MTAAPLPLRPPLPRSLYLETTSRCNSLCETCILTFGGREPQRDLSWAEFRQVVDQFPAIDRVLLHGIGEPLLNRDLPRMVAHLKARHADVLFNSNAITLSPKTARALIDAGLDELRVSLDASTRATYTRIRGVDAFDRVMENLEQLAHLKGDLGVTRPLVSLWFTALQDNVEEARPRDRGTIVVWPASRPRGRPDPLGGNGSPDGGGPVLGVRGGGTGSQPDAVAGGPALERLSSAVDARLRHGERQRVALLHRAVDHRSLQRHHPGQPVP